MTQTKDIKETKNRLSTQKFLRTLMPESLVMELSMLSERLGSNRAPLISLKGDSEGTFHTNQSNG